jgi:hypothetical protein
MILTKEIEVLREKKTCSQCHITHHKTHMDCLATETGPSPREAGN